MSRQPKELANLTEREKFLHQKVQNYLLCRVLACFLKILRKKVIIGVLMVRTSG